jgi:hypothetical protein
MKEGRNGLFKATTSALRQIERAARLPNADKLLDMTDIEIESQNEEIAYAIKQHEGHVWRDHDDLHDENPSREDTRSSRNVKSTA